jgi:hypothetical protein
MKTAPLITAELFAFAMAGVARVRVEYENYGTVSEQNGSGRADASLVSGSAIVRF